MDVDRILKQKEMTIAIRSQRGFQLLPSDQEDLVIVWRLVHLCALTKWRLKSDMGLGLWLPGWFGVFPVVVRHTNWVAAVGCH